MPRSIATVPFGTTATGEVVDLFTLTNANGIEVRAITYGGIILSIKTPDRDGRWDDIVLGFDSLEPYEAGSPYFGSIIGRYGNRIARGQFTLDGETFALATNNGPNHLHGGDVGFDKVVWGGEAFEREDAVGVAFTYTSADGEEGYPGTMEVRVTYTLTDADELIFDYRATTDRATPVNLTQHSYFNLAGGASDDILGHELTLDASRFTPVDTTLIPTGELAPRRGHALRLPHRHGTIGARINDDHPQLAAGLGYDHNFVLDGADPDANVRVNGKQPRGPASRGVRARARHRPHPGDPHRGAGDPVLLRELSRRYHRGQGRPRLRSPERVLPGDAALSGLPQPARLPFHHSPSRRGVRHAHRSDLRGGGLTAWRPSTG